MTLRDLRLRARALLRPRQVERELDEELAFHVERETRKHIEAGLTRDDARNRAVARFGPVTLAADQCRDQRGTALVDEAARDIGYAFRTFRRAPLAACTIVTTVALGLGLVAIVFTFLNALLFRVDQVRNPGELYAVERPRAAGAEDRAPFTRPEFETLRRETSVFVDAYAVIHDIDSRIGGMMMGGALVTGNFFEVLGVSAALGRSLSPSDDQPPGRPVIVLSHAAWSRHFANDPAIIGRVLLVNGAAHVIVGVMSEGFRGLSVAAPDYWAPLSQLGQHRPIHAGREDRVGVEVIGRLRPGLSPQTAAAGLNVWAAGGARRDTVAARPQALRLEPRRGTVSESTAELVLVFMPLFFAFGLILLIGCANVVNLLLARAVSRQREIGIRLSLGASRRRIVRQLLTESLLLAVAAAALGLLVSRVALAVALSVVTQTMPPEFAETVRLTVPSADWRVLLFLLAGAVVATVAFGLAPALQATRLELVRTIRGEVTRDARPSRARQALITLQVTAAALLLICAAVFLRSAFASATVDPGLRTVDTVMIEIVNERMRTAIVQAVGRDPSVAAVAASSPDVLSAPRGAFARTPAASAPAFYRLVSPEYFSVLGIGLVRGRGFLGSERAAESGVAIVSESLARELWPQDEAVGQVLQVEQDPSTRRADDPMLPVRTFTVVGVARDVPGFRVAGYREANLYFPTSAETARHSLTVRVLGDPDLARRGLLDRLTFIDPNMGQVITMRTLARMEAYFLQMAFWLTFLLGGLALLLTVSGLFSVLSYLVEQRRKEIVVRMALGATAGEVSRLVLAHSIRPVGIGLALGCGLAVALATLLLSTTLAEQIGDAVRVFDPVAYAASLLGIVAACVTASLVPALRAARIDPMAILRQD